MKALWAKNWERIAWDERSVGYGADDGIMLCDIRAAGLRMNRDADIYHVEHPGATFEPNKPGTGRRGCYGRDRDGDGFNFDNFEENRKLHRQKRG